MTDSREAKLTLTFVTLADTLVAGYDVVDLLDTLVNASAEVLDAAEAGLILASNTGELSVIASTSERSRLVEMMQLKHGQGPCVECYVTGKVVTVPDVEALDKWLDFRAAALEQGLHSVHAVPLRLRGTVIGALNLFRSQKGTLTAEDTLVAQALADVATIGIIQERTLRESDVARQQLQHALDSRVLIEQAKGVLAHRHGVDMDVAFRTLRDYSRNNGLLLRTVAEQVVNRSLSI